ncbi:MAG: heme biosynthesis protein HemY [Dongiaceae bacterium]
MRRIIFYLFLAAWLGLVSIAAYVLTQRPGDVSVVWLGHRIDMPVWFVLVALIAALVVAALGWQLARVVFRSPRQFARARQDRRRRKAYRALTQGMVAVAAGDATEAQRQAKLAGNLLKDPPLTLLLEAQAAQLGGDETAATRYFRAMLDHPEAAFLGLRGLLMQALKTGNDTAALGFARQAVEARPKTAWAVSTLLDLELKSGAWPQAEATLKRAEKLGVVEHAAARRTRAVLLTEQARGDIGVDAAIARLREAVKLAPDLVSARALLAATFVRAGRGREAARIIEQGWSSSPHAELAAVYAQIDPAEDALARARRFERLAALHPAHLESRIALAGANLAAGLWGPARAELDKALAQVGGAATAPQRLARLMAHLEEGEGTDPAAARRWLIAATAAPADPAWTCDKCGTIATAWTARCPHCRQFDSLVWRATPRPAPLALDGGLPTVPALAAPAAGPPATPPAGAAEPAAPAAPEQRRDAAPVDAARLVN